MARPGMKAGEDYIEHPYLPSWRPVEDRQWAEAYLNADGTENYLGFVVEFRNRHKWLRVNGVDTYLPESVDGYLRVDRFGFRQDIDWELATTPLTEEEKQLMKQEKARLTRERRIAALRARGRDIPKVLAEAHAAAEAVENAHIEPPKRRGRPPKVSVGALLAAQGNASPEQ